MSQVKSSRGPQQVTLEELARIKPPAPEERWRPVGHSAILGIVESALESGGHAVVDRALYVFRGDDARFLAVLDLDQEVSACASLVVGVTSSTDRSLPFSFFAGHRSRGTGGATFRKNLAAKCKHTPNGLDRFTAEVRAGVDEIPEHLRRELDRIERMKRTGIAPHCADSLILRAFERRIITTRRLGEVVREWRAPRHEELAEPTYWSFESVIASVLDRSADHDVLIRHIRATMLLGALIDSELERFASEAAPAS